jgi:hypothetical protein
MLRIIYMSITIHVHNVLALALCLLAIRTIMAFDSADLQHLLKGHDYIGCDLQAADLRGMDLRNIRLQEADQGLTSSLGCTYKSAVIPAIVFTDHATRTRQPVAPSHLANRSGYQLRRSAQH